MKFSEAMKLLEEGKKAKDINWYGKRFIFYDKDLQEIYDEIGEPYPISGEDLEIIWEEYIEPETKKIEPLERKSIIGAFEIIDKINELIERMN